MFYLLWCWLFVGLGLFEFVIGCVVLYWRLLIYCFVYLYFRVCLVFVLVCWLVALVWCLVSLVWLTVFVDYADELFWCWVSLVYFSLCWLLFDLIVLWSVLEGECFDFCCLVWRRLLWVVFVCFSLFGIWDCFGCLWFYKLLYLVYYFALFGLIWLGLIGAWLFVFLVLNGCSFCLVFEFAW